MALHVDRKGSTQAVKVLLQALRIAPGDQQAIWLLNVANMTLGSWPDAVPAEWRIAADAFESEYPLPRMVNVATELGIDRSMSRAGGSILDDFDGDGRLDILLSSKGFASSVAVR